MLDTQRGELTISPRNPFSSFTEILLILIQNSDTVSSYIMSNTYSQISIHAVFAVRHRDNIITIGWRDELHKYISGIITNEDCTSLAVGGWRDHVHIFFGMPPSIRISDFMRIVKTNSSKWINERSFVKGKFQWQDGYGAFSHSRSQRDKVIQYVMNQEIHHKTLTFRNEYLGLLENFEVKFDNKYVFEFYE